jgi:hypothetical protein
MVSNAVVSGFVFWGAARALVDSFHRERDHVLVSTKRGADPGGSYADVHFARNSFDEARQGYMQILDMDPLNIAALVGYVLTFEQEEWPAAFTACPEVLYAVYKELIASSAVSPAQFVEVGSWLDDLCAGRFHGAASHATPALVAN